VHISHSVSSDLHVAIQSILSAFKSSNFTLSATFFCKTWAGFLLYALWGVRSGYLGSYSIYPVQPIYVRNLSSRKGQILCKKWVWSPTVLLGHNSWVPTHTALSFVLYVPSSVQRIFFVNAAPALQTIWNHSIWMITIISSSTKWGLCASIASELVWYGTSRYFRSLKVLFNYL
jgi:hypothetical protein